MIIRVFDDNNKTSKTVRVNVGCGSNHLTINDFNGLHIEIPMTDNDGLLEWIKTWKSIYKPDGSLDDTFSKNLDFAHDINTLKNQIKNQNDNIFDISKHLWQAYEYYCDKICPIKDKVMSEHKDVDEAMDKLSEQCENCNPLLEMVKLLEKIDKN